MAGLFGRQSVCRALVCTPVVLLSCCVAIAGAETGIENAVEVSSAAIRDSSLVKGMASVEFELKSLSPQVITAWKVLVIGRYVNGATESRDWEVDEVASLLPVLRYLAWQPGSARKGQVAVFRGQLQPIPDAVL